MNTNSAAKNIPVTAKEDNSPLPAPRLDKHTIPVILWNLFPLAGVLFLGWKPGSVFICYAMETVVAGVFNVFRMMAINYGLPPQERKSALFTLGMITFFLLHYYFIVFIQLFIFFRNSSEYDGLLQAIFLIIAEPSYYAALGAFVLNNVLLFINGFILTGMYTKRSMGWQMFEPYQRIFIQQPVVMLGGFLLGITGSSYPVLIIFVAVKLVMDVFPTRTTIFGYRYLNYAVEPTSK